MVYIMIFCHVCFYTQIKYTVQVVGVISSPESPKYQPIRMVARWVSHGIVESWSQDGETVGLQLTNHYIMEPHTSRKEKRALRDKKKTWPFNCDSTSAKIYRTVASKSEVWYQWTLKRKKMCRVKLWKIGIWLVLQVVLPKLTQGGKYSHLHRVVRGHRRSSWQGLHKRSHNSHPLLVIQAQEICSHSRFFLQGICELQMQNAS